MGFVVEEIWFFVFGVDDFIIEESEIIFVLWICVIVFGIRKVG